MRPPVLLALLLLLAASPSKAAAGDLTPQEARGKQLYTQGTSPSGREIKAALGEDETEVPAAVLPCSGCHGLDGHGGKEGGIRPSNLTREALSRPTGDLALGRRRPAYDDPLLVRAVTHGLDPAGNRLHVAMPRYRLTRQDAADLLAYLKRLGHEEEPGLDGATIHLGVLLPGGGHRRESQAEAVRAALAGRCAELNRGGGLYGRQLTLHFVQLPEAPAERVEKLRDFLAGTPVFSLIGADLEGAETGMAEVAQSAGMPLISTLASHPQEGFALNRYVFYLTPGLAEETKALAEFAARPPRRGKLVMVPSGEMAEIAGGVAAAARVGDRLFVSLPVLPLEWMPEAAGSYRKLAAGSRLPTHDVTAQRTALAAVEVLIEVFKRSGREVSREQLVAALEKLYRFDAGLGTPVTFGPNRRIGMRGAFVAAVDLARHTLAPPVSWIEIGP
jgi:ABC-type branched-subunit amino acid transport system substrate-binding protein/cytochrome c553